MNSSDLPDLICIGVFDSATSARKVQKRLFTQNSIVSAVAVERIGPFELARLMVAAPELSNALAAISKIDRIAMSFSPPSEYDALKQRLRERVLFYVDMPEDTADFRGRSESRHEAPGDVTDKVVEQIRKLFGDEEAKRMKDTFEKLEPKPQRRPEASIIILMHNKWRHTQRCLWGLFDTKDVSWELVLVDNGSTDRDLREGISNFLNECLLREIPVRLISFTENVGAVKGRNEAIPHCTGDHIVFMDNDVVVRSRTWLRKAIDFLRSNPKAGAVGAKLLYPNKPHLIQCAGCDVSPTGRVNFRGRGEPNDSPEFNSDREVQCLISACIVFPKRVVQQVGLLDMAYSPVQFEDIDYCYRIKELGYTLHYLSGMEMYHFENVTTGGTKKLNYTYLTVKNGKIFKDRWYHVFSKENGPDERTMVWKDIPTVNIADIRELEVID
ncbi:MAG: hypothetical protein Kow00107_10740 [Planctomycetota bacterium]